MRILDRQLPLRALGAAAGLAIALAATGCGSNTLDKATVEQGAKDALEKTVGREPQSIKCPKDLDAKVGASQRCTLTDHGTTLGMTVRVTRVNGDKASFDVVVDQKPQK
ncbi:MAG TPA: DUF4333 domain-containing protein [Thermoleophilaceae bacterium]|nr:DUF4333 domain-containing protein [Thermoleophilaceae bacterium]